MTDTASPQDGQSLSDSDGACEPVGWADEGGPTFSEWRGRSCWALFLSPTYALLEIEMFKGLVRSWPGQVECRD